MTPEDLVEELKAALPGGLKSVVLYGSAAAGDHVGKVSDYNVLVVTESLGLKELRALSKPSRRWTREGNPPPLLFTETRLQRSADVFPIEILDILQSHRVLFGEDVVAGLDITTDNLRLELEHELKGKLIQLRERYLDTGGKPARVAELMATSLSTFLVLLRGALRLFEKDVPSVKLDVPAKLAAHLSFDTEIFGIVNDLRKGNKKVSGDAADALFARYLRTLEQVADGVDAYLNKTVRGE